MSKLTLFAAGAAGYVLGARAGRQRYEQIAAGARRVMSDPRVRSARRQATEAVVDKAKETASTAASAAADKVRRGNGGSHASDQGWPADTAAPPAS